MNKEDAKAIADRIVDRLFGDCLTPEQIVGKLSPLGKRFMLPDGKGLPTAKEFIFIFGQGLIHRNELTDRGKAVVKLIEQE